MAQVAIFVQPEKAYWSIRFTLEGITMDSNGQDLNADAQITSNPSFNVTFVRDFSLSKREPPTIFVSGWSSTSSGAAFFAFTLYASKC